MANEPGLDASVPCRVTVPGADRRFDGRGDVSSEELGIDFGPPSLATALVLERIYFALDFFAVGSLL